MAQPSGRWPSNVVLSHDETCEPGDCADWCVVKALDEQSGERPSGAKRATPRANRSGWRPETNGKGVMSAVSTYESEASTGTASRFFPQFWHHTLPPTERRTPSVQLIHGDCLDALRTLPDCSVDSVVTDPPSGISFMGKAWDSDRGGRDQWIAWLAERLTECFRVLKPGGHAVVWALPRTSGWTHRAIEDAGFEVRDCLTHLFGCLSEDTEIMVDGQWVHYHECADGRLALCYDNDRDEFSWQPIEQVYVYPDYCDTAYRLRGDHTDQLVSREHRCIVERGGSYVFERAEDAAQERQARVPVLEDVRGLLDALPLPHEGASDPQEDLREDVPGHGGRQVRTHAQAAPDVSALRQDLQPTRPGARQGEALLVSVCGQGQGGPAGLVGAYAAGGRARPVRLDGGQRGVVPREDDGRAEPCVEGRGDLLPQAWQLLADQVRPLPAGVPGDGTQGRLRHGAPAPRGASARPSVAPAGGCASRESRPDGQPAGEPVAVRQQPGPQAVRASRFTRSDLVRIEPVEYRGLIWCVKVPTGAFVARRNGKVFVTGNSGFPKSLDVGKAIDKRPGVGRHAEFAAELKAARLAAGYTNSFDVARLVVGRHTGAVANWEKYQWPEAKWWPALRDLLGMDGAKWDPIIAEAERERLGDKAATQLVVAPGEGRPRPGVTLDVTAPATPEAQRWSGWGTALKPSAEFWFLARRPLDGTVAATVTRWGTGAINVDGCRVAAAEPLVRPSVQRFDNSVLGKGLGAGVQCEPAGRWPPNTLVSHDPSCTDGDCSPGCAAAELDKQSGERPGAVSCGRKGVRGVYEDGIGSAAQVPSYGDSGGCSRFFPTFRYVAKPSTREKAAGLDDRNHHPTVKPVELCRWLCRLVTPPGGVVLDCFAGSGTVGVAAILEGFTPILIEAEEEYLPSIEGRVRWALGQTEQASLPL